MKTPNTKEQARLLFFQTNLTQKQIAEYVGVNERTLFDWMKQGDWKRARAAATAAPVMLADSYYNQLARMSEFIEQRDERPFATKEEADIIRKLTMSVKQLNGNSANTAPEMAQFCMLFSSFLQKRSPAITVQVVEVMDEFINSFMPGKQSYLKKVAAEREIRTEYTDYLNDLKAPDFPEEKNEGFGSPEVPTLTKDLTLNPTLTLEPTPEPHKPEKSGSSEHVTLPPALTKDLTLTSTPTLEQDLTLTPTLTLNNPPTLTLKSQPEPEKSGPFSGPVTIEDLPVSASIIPGLPDSEARRYLRIFESEANTQAKPPELPESPGLIDALEYAAQYFTPGYCVLRDVYDVPEQQIDLLLTKFMMGEFNYSSQH